MARDGSGVYSLPANTLAVTGDTVSSTKFNTLVQDIEAVLNTARPVVKGGTGATTAAGARTALGLEIGTNVQAYDAGLASIAGLTTAANKMIYTTAADTYAVADLSAFARTILDDADAASVRATIGAGTGGGDLLAANNLSDLASASTARGNLGLGTMATEAAADYAALAGAAFTGAVTMAADLNVDSGTLFVDVSANRVGIGTSSPSGKLHSYSGSSGATISANADEFVIEGAGAVGMTIASTAAQVGNIFFADPGGAAVGYFQYSHASNFLAVGVNGSEAFRIDSSRNVGIGTTSPLGPLSVEVGSRMVTIKEGNGGSTYPAIQATNTAGTGWSYLEYEAYQHRFYVNGDSDMSLIINNAGNVGIGTSAPDNTLDVNGGIKGQADYATASGTLVAANHYKGTIINCSGNITFANAAGSGDHGVLVAGSASRTINKGTTTMYVNGSSVTSATLAARGVAGFIFIGSGTVYLSGDVS